MSSQNFFRDSCTSEQNYFDEGPPTVKKTSTYPSGSIDTLKIDPYRQGVELTQTKHYDAGSFKIYSGMPGHRLYTSHYGHDCYAKNVVFLPTHDVYSDADLVNPTSRVASLPRSEYASDAMPAKEYEMNGVLEPLTIRDLITRRIKELPVVAHGVKANTTNGNIDAYGTSDRITIVKRSIEYTNGTVRFDELSTLKDPKRSNAPVTPFNDDRNEIVTDNAQTGMWPTEFIVQLASMSGSTENYVPWKHRSSVCGWEFGDSITGTDSIAFGGMSY